MTEGHSPQLSDVNAASSLRLCNRLGHCPGQFCFRLRAGLLVSAPPQPPHTASPPPAPLPPSQHFSPPLIPPTFLATPLLVCPRRCVR